MSQSDSSTRSPDQATPRSTVVAVTAGLLLVATLVLASSSAGKAALQRWRYEQAPAPPIELVDVRSGEAVRLADYQGKVVLLDFWATWCPPCREQMPAVERIARDDELAADVQVLSINTDEPEAGRARKVRKFLRRGDFTMRTLLDTGAASRAYQVFSIPTLVVIGPDGRVEALRQGAHSEQQLRELIAEAR